MGNPMISNPVLTGFNPDPSIVRVGEDYYIATSTFEWYPGVQISHSKNLRDWKVVSRPLTRYSQLDLRGCPNSGGVWAPCLTFQDGVYYLIFTDVKYWAGDFKVTHNYLVTATAIDGDWSDPIFLNSSGFDPTLFHDEDGRKWLLNVLWDHRPLHQSFAGILLQEYDPSRKALVGEVKNIFLGSSIGLVEGPHVYQRKGYYYLLTAEGGTFRTHAATVARAKHIAGPYELMPDNPLLSSAKNPELKLQSGGHGCFVENSDGSWLFAHLCRRPLKGGRSILGRETAIQNIEWINDWPRLKSGNTTPQEAFDSPFVESEISETASVTDNFESTGISLDWQAPRIPITQFTSLTEKPGYLRIYGREAIVSMFEQSLVARRQKAFHIAASTCLQYQPENIQQMAGLVAFYNTHAFYYLYVTYAEHSKKCLGIMRCEKGVLSYLIEKEYPLDDWDNIYLKLEIEFDRIRFFYSENGQEWFVVGSEYDASILSDEHALPCGFTGNFVGMACQDISGIQLPADFEWFKYEEL